MLATWSPLVVQIQELTAGGDLVIAYLLMTATGKRTGTTFSFPVAEMFRFRDGRVVEWRPIYSGHLYRSAGGGGTKVISLPRRAGIGF